jgi:hypothetical protein
MKTRLVPTKLALMLPGEGGQEFQVDLPERPSITELHAVIDPLLNTAAWEHVVVYVGLEAWLGASQYRDMFVDETGQLKGLPRNEEATFLYRRNYLMHETDPGDAESLHFIAGPAAFFPERKVWS